MRVKNYNARTFGGISCYMTISVTLICKNEEENLKRLLPTLTFADEIVVVDTGSCDGTVTVARRYTDNVYFYSWRDNFASARNYAVKKANCDYVMWLDADDELPEAAVNKLAELKRTPDPADTYFMRYRMGQNGEYWFWRERIVRRCAKCRFNGFIHEAITPFGRTEYISADVVHNSSADHSARNLAIYQSALARGKRFTARDRYYYARTLMENGMTAEAEPILERFCRNVRAYEVDRAHGCKLLARISLTRKDYAKALSALSVSVAILPPDAETCCLFGDVYLAVRRYDLAAVWYEYALSSNCQYGFVNGYYKLFYPCVSLSVCYWNLNDRQKAKAYHLRARTLRPTDSTVISNDKWFA